MRPGRAHLPGLVLPAPEPPVPATRPEPCHDRRPRPRPRARCRAAAAGPPAAAAASAARGPSAPAQPPWRRVAPAHRAGPGGLGGPARVDRGAPPSGCSAETGIDFLHPRARELWAAAGADVDGHRVRLDGDLVDSLVARAPAEFTLHARNPDHDVHMGGDSVAFGAVASAPYVGDAGPGTSGGQPCRLRQPAPAHPEPQRAAPQRRLSGRADRPARLRAAPGGHPVDPDPDRQGAARLQPRGPAQHRLPGDGAHRPSGRRRRPWTRSRRSTRSSTPARRCATTSRCSRASCSTPRATRRW